MPLAVILFERYFVADPADRNLLCLNDQDKRELVVFRNLGVVVWILCFVFLSGWLVYEGTNRRPIRHLFESQWLHFGGKPLLNLTKTVDSCLRFGGQVVRGCVVNMLLLISVIWVAEGWVLAVLIFLTIRQIRNRSNPRTVTDLCLVIVGCMGCYFGMRMFNEAEYKFLILLNVTLGILGGVGVWTLRPRLGTDGMPGLLEVFEFPVALDLISMIRPPEWVNRRRQFLRQLYSFDYNTTPVRPVDENNRRNRAVEVYIQQCRRFSTALFYSMR